MLGFVVTLPGSPVPSTGVVAVNGTLLLTRPLTATVTLPVVACDGTVTVRDNDEAAVTVAATGTPFAPAKVTELLVAIELKPKPLITTLPPSGPELGVRGLVMLGGGGGGGGLGVVEGGQARPPAAPPPPRPQTAPGR